MQGSAMKNGVGWVHVLSVGALDKRSSDTVDQGLMAGKGLTTTRSAYIVAPLIHRR